MKTISKILVSLLALVPLFAFAQVITDPEVPKATPIRYSQAHNEQIIREVFGSEAENAIKVSICESNLNNLAVGDGGWSIGVFQIYTKVHTKHSKEQLKDPIYNIQVAKELFDKRGWGAWTCRKVLL